MKRWFFIEDCTSSRSEVYNTPLVAENATEAFIKASVIWDHLTESDKSKRDEAYIGYAETDENCFPDYDSMTDIWYFREDGKTVYYILDEYEGYGSEGPVCSDPKETARLLEGWNYPDSDDPLPDEWHVASRREIEYCGTYDGFTDTFRPGTRETENE